MHFFNLTHTILNSVKLEHFRNLVSLSAIDGKIDDVERVALSKIAFEQGLDTSTKILFQVNELGRYPSLSLIAECF